MNSIPVSRRDWLLRASVPLWAPAAPAQAAKPNILFLVVDDLDCRIGCYGDPVAKTPNLDRLARQGVRFDRAYCQFPLCNPTRSSVLSGRYPTSTGVLDNNTWLTLEDGQHMMPEYFQRNGYQIGTFGKIWHGPNKGFHRGDPLPPSQNASAWSTARDRARQQSEDPAYWEKSFTPYRTMRLPEPRNYAVANNYGPLPDGDPGVDVPIADDALGWLQKAQGGAKPFFLAVGFHRPHVPLIAPKKYFDMFDPTEMRLPVDFDTEPRAIRGVPRDEFRQNIDLFAARSFSTLEAREAMRAYYACIAYMDDQVGRLLDRIQAMGVAGNTIVVLWGDHGWHLGEKGMWAKGTLFETSARGPMIISDPRLRTAGQASPRVVQYLDMYPTLVDLCGLPKASWHEGTSLAPLLADPRREWDRPAYTVQVRSWFIGRSLRNERWRYTEWDEGRRGAALYDHDSDPHEMRNLAAVPTWSRQMQELQRQLRSGPIARNPPGA